MCNVVITRCIFSDNTNYSSGGAISNYSYGEGGKVTIENCAFAGNKSDENGGAVTNDNHINVTIISCDFSKNSGGSYGLGGAIHNNNGCNVSITASTFSENSAANGGAIYNYATLTITNCSFDKNTAEEKTEDIGSARGGGAIYCGKDLTLQNCSFTENVSQTNGGAIYKDVFLSGTTTVTLCKFSYNIARNGDGGAFYDWAGYTNATFTDCVFEGNYASTNGGAVSEAEDFTNCTFIYNSASENGGAVYNVHGLLLKTCLSNCTFAYNSASSGGAVYSEYNNELFAVNCTFVMNKANSSDEISTSGIVTLINSIIWNTNPNCIYVSPNTYNVMVNCAAASGSVNESAFASAKRYGYTGEQGTINITDWLSTHKSKDVSVDNVVQTIFELTSMDLKLIHGGINASSDLEIHNPSRIEIIKTLLSESFDQIGVKRNAENPTIGAVEYVGAAYNESSDGNETQNGSGTQNESSQGNVNNETTPQQNNQNNNVNNNVPENTGDPSSGDGGGGGCNTFATLSGLALIFLKLKRK